MLKWKEKNHLLQINDTLSSLYSFSYLLYQLSVCYNVNAVGISPTRPKTLSHVQQHHSELLLFSNQTVFERTFAIYLLDIWVFNLLLFFSFVLPKVVLKGNI